MTDNGQPFKSATLYKLYAKYKRKGLFLTVPRICNGLAESFNKALCMILEKMVDKNKWTWLDNFLRLYGLIEQPSEPCDNTTLYSWVFEGEPILGNPIFLGLRRRTHPPAENTTLILKIGHL